MGYGGWDDPLDLGYNDPLTDLQEGVDIGNISPGEGEYSDWTKVLGNLMQGAGGALGGAAGGAAAGGSKAAGSFGDVLKNLFGGGGGGINDWMALLALLGGIGANVNAGNTAKAGGEQIKAAADKSNEQADALIKGAMAQYDPYKQAGVNAIGQMQPGAFDIASKFVSQGTRPNLKGGVSLSALAKR